MYEKNDEQGMMNLYRAALGGEAAFVEVALDNVIAGSSVEAADRLRALALQFTLHQDFRRQIAALGALQASRATWTESDGEPQEVSQFIEQFRRSTDESVASEATQDEDTHKALVSELANTENLHVIAEAIEGKLPDKAWLVSRASITRDAVTESLWNIIQEVSHYRAETPEGQYPEWLCNEIDEQFRIANENLQEAVDGLHLVQDNVEED